MNARPSGATGQPLPWADTVAEDGFLARWEAETTDTPAAPSAGGLEGTVTAAAEVERLRVMYRVVSEREHDLINERDRLLTEADAAQARIAELVAQRDDALRDLATGDLPDSVPAARGARCVAYRLRRMAEATQADAAGAGEEL